MEKIIAQKEKIRIDKYLGEVTDFSRSQIEKMISQKNVFVNDNTVKASYKLKLEDVITFDSIVNQETDIVPTPMDLNIVFENENVMIIDKPSGLVVHPGSGNFNNTLANGLLYYTKNLSDINGETRPGIVHRIDKDTSGLLIIAKNNEAHQILSEDFKNKNIKRKYIALIEGKFPNKYALIDAPIGRDEQNRKKMTVTAKNSKHAVTHLKVLKRYQKYTLVELELETGRTHQIRVHLSHIGYPVYNDPVYGKRECSEFGQFLHSADLEFIEPITKESLHFTSPLPNEFKEFLETLEELDTKEN